MRIVSWSRRGDSRHDQALKTAQVVAEEGKLPLEKGHGFYLAELEMPRAGTLVMEISSPRPLRIWLEGERVVDEPLFWRSYQRQLRATLVVPLPEGRVQMLVEVGERWLYHGFLDADSPSRNREHVMAEVMRRIPDCLVLSGVVSPPKDLPIVSLRFNPGQFHRDGVTWQEVIVRSVPRVAQAPSNSRSYDEEPPELLRLSTAVYPAEAHETTGPKEQQAGIRRIYVPVTAPGEVLPPLRTSAREDRVEPSFGIVRRVPLTIEGGRDRVTVEMPAYESVGRLAPQREFRKLEWPSYEDAKDRLPEPILPEEWKKFARLYDEAWRMLLRLVHTPRAEGGFPNPYIRTSPGFKEMQFVWDTSFTAMATAYGCRALPVYATMDCLYSRQFDGGYIHRENDGYDGLPALFEPDFGPNPPIMSVAEWKIASVTGNAYRLAQVYPILAEYSRWVDANRRLEDGTFWTTGLANGLDNSPSLGEGYPDLTAQMVHNAEMLANIAGVLGKTAEQAAWLRRREEIARALNERLWSPSMRFYSTSLREGGHNPNKVVTGFWPLWAGVVSEDRVESLAEHLTCPTSFWRHHPIPSLAADSPSFRPEGVYWLGSTWAPTNYATIKGFWRAGRRDLALRTSVRHLQCMLEVFDSTGAIWENYCSEESRPGSWSGPQYCWSSLGPIALLLEVLIGLESDALNRTLQWRPPQGKSIGVNRFPLGPCTISLHQHQEGARDVVDITTDFPFTLKLVRGEQTRNVECRQGTVTVDV